MYTHEEKLKATVRAVLACSPGFSISDMSSVMIKQGANENRMLPIPLITERKEYCSSGSRQVTVEFGEHTKSMPTKAGVTCAP
mmetsp:Transcript_57/g.137  ORF Transcript_57/g.137 Transcript_57/m.137 type:complete len:83 (+) Transcript_57:362-610(+)